MAMSPDNIIIQMKKAIIKLKTSQKEAASYVLCIMKLNLTSYRNTANINECSSGTYNPRQK